MVFRVVQSIQIPRQCVYSNFHAKTECGVGAGQEMNNFFADFTKFCLN